MYPKCDKKYLDYKRAGTLPGLACLVVAAEIKKTNCAATMGVAGACAPGAGTAPSGLEKKEPFWRSAGTERSEPTDSVTVPTSGRHRAAQISRQAKNYSLLIRAEACCGPCLTCKMYTPCGKVLSETVPCEVAAGKD